MVHTHYKAHHITLRQRCASSRLASGCTTLKLSGSVSALAAARAAVSCSICVCACPWAAQHDMLCLLWCCAGTGAVPQHWPHVLAGVVRIVPGAVKAGLQQRWGWVMGWV